MKNTILLEFVFCLCLIFFSCKRQEPGVSIGFSQCTGGDWRDQMNQQMSSEINFYENARLEIRNANGKIENQIADIHYFIEKKVDILIISPFEDKALVDTFNKIDFKGIPILLIDRNLSSNKHIAFVGASNIEVGKIAAQFAVKQIGDKTSNILLIRGYEKSSATMEREEGFVKTIEPHKNIRIITINAGKDVDGRDLSETKKVIYEKRDLLKEVDIVYAFNDAMAMIASDEAKGMGLEHNLQFIGVDGRFGYNGGIDAIKNGKLSATIVYPTGGDKAIEIAMKIINKIPVQRNISLPLILIDSSSVDSYYQQGLILQDYINKIEVLHAGRVDLFSDFSKQKQLLKVCTILIIFLFIGTLSSIFFLQATRRRLLQLQHSKINIEECLPKKEEELNELFKTESSSKEEHAESDVHTKFKMKIDSLLEEYYTDFDFSMSVLADKSALSRVQFYRKFKLVYNETPNNYIRKYRLKKAVDLICTEEYNFSEIAYKVGYNSPAYFTKCFRDEYQCTPSEFLSKEKHSGGRHTHN